MIEIANLCVKYGDNTVYDNFNLNIYDGEVTCVLGESGCGKTTLLNAVAGLVDYKGTITPVKVSYVFQTPRLVPALTILNNLTLIGADKSKAADMLERVGLGDKLNAYPIALSGGETQRVSLLRALLYDSDALLLDEPFSSLDLKTKLGIIKLFNGYVSARSGCTLLVTHDIDECLYVADRILVCGEGQIIADLKNPTKGEYGESSPLREQIVKLLLQV